MTADTVPPTVPQKRAHPIGWGTGARFWAWACRACPGHAGARWGTGVPGVPGARWGTVPGTAARL